MKKRVICLMTALCLLTVLTGCSGNGGEEQIAVETLPPATVRWEAPDGDRTVRQGVPFINYGILIAHMNGILERSVNALSAPLPGVL